MRIRRSLQLALAGAVLTSLALASPVAAIQRSVLMPTQVLRPDIGQYNVTFSGLWDVYQGRDAGTTWWFVSKPEVTAHIVGGWACVNSGTCKHTWVEAKIQFIRANGTVHSTVGLTSGNQCWTHYGSNDPVYRACKASTYQVPLGVTGIRWSARLHTMSDWRIDRVTNWSVKQVAIGG